jgi:hypothetical protein
MKYSITSLTTVFVFRFHDLRQHPSVLPKPMEDSERISDSLRIELPDQQAIILLETKT